MSRDYLGIQSRPGPSPLGPPYRAPRPMAGYIETGELPPPRARIIPAPIADRTARSRAVRIEALAWVGMIASVATLIIVAYWSIKAVGR